MSTTDMTVVEMVESMTGFEEIAAERHFHKSIGDLVGDEGSSMGGRALIFTHQMRSESDPNAVKKRVMEMPLREVNAYFADEPEDVIEDEPDSEAGKGEPSPDDELTTSLPSA